MGRRLVARLAVLGPASVQTVVVVRRHVAVPGAPVGAGRGEPLRPPAVASPPARGVVPVLLAPLALAVLLVPPRRVRATGQAAVGQRLVFGDHPEHARRAARDGEIAPLIFRLLPTARLRRRFRREHRRDGDRHAKHHADRCLLQVHVHDTSTDVLTRKRFGGQP